MNRIKDVLERIESAKDDGATSMCFDDIHPFDCKKDTSEILEKLSEDGYRMYSYHYDYGSASGLKVSWGEW